MKTDRKEYNRLYLREWRKRHPGYNRPYLEAWKKANPDWILDYQRQWRDNHPGFAAAASKRWKLANPEKYSSSNEAWKKANSEKDRANEQVQYAVSRGVLVRLPCQICGDLKSHAHHKDYAKPFDVEWLCAKHHKQQHRKAELQT